MFRFTLIVIGVLFVLHILGKKSSTTKLIEVVHKHPNPTHTHKAYVTMDSLWYNSKLPVKNWEYITIKDTLYVKNSEL